MANDSEYEVRLDIFEGPMDLLVHLIRKNEVDIFDIPISTITDQYLKYLDIMKALNMNVAGEFLVMASTLMHIKSKMLLPETDEEDEEDPRLEITRPLLEYLRLKEAAGELSERDLLERDVFGRRIPVDFNDQFPGEEPVLVVNLFQLMDAFKKIVERSLPGSSLTLDVEKWSIKEKTALIIDRLKKLGPLFFRDLFDQDQNISEFIITFLALLELVHLGLIRIFQTDLDRDIQVEGLFTENEDPNYGEIAKIDY